MSWRWNSLLYTHAQLLVSIGSDEDGLRLLLEQEQRQPQWINLKRYMHALISYAKEFSIIMLEDWWYYIYGDNGGN